MSTSAKVAAFALAAAAALGGGAALGAAVGPIDVDRSDHPEHRPPTTEHHEEGHG